VVHCSLTVHEIPRASRHPNIAHQKEPVLQELPDHATDNDLSVVHSIVSRCSVLSPHESHGASNLTRPDGLRTNIRLQKSNNETHVRPPDRRNSYGL